MGIMTSIGSWLSLHGDGLCRTELTGNVAFLSRWVVAQCMFPLEAWTQWALLKWIVAGGRVLKEVAQVHRPDLGWVLSTSESKLHGQSWTSCPSQATVHSHTCRWLPLHCYGGFGHWDVLCAWPGPRPVSVWMRSDGTSWASPARSLAQVRVSREAQLDVVTRAEWRNFDDYFMFS